MSRKCSFPSRADDERRAKAVLKASNRGIAADKWRANHPLNKDTFAAFQAHMKQVDKDYDNGIKVQP